MKVSFITTVFNEEKTITRLLDSLLKQTQLPQEIIIVDGGSKDLTITTINKYITKRKNERFKNIIFKVLKKQGNRSVGRNEAIKQAKNEIIVCSDSGNIIDKNWIKNIIKPFKNKNVDVVAGYYKGKAENIFQKALIPFALVMEDKLNPRNFLPATRSIAFKKTVWKKTGGFDEKLSHNEDYVFARKLKENGATIVFAKDAIVEWIPRSTFKQAFVMMCRFAYGDIEAKIYRSKVLLLFARYIVGLYFLGLCFLYKSLLGLGLLFTALGIYIIGSIIKNYRYVQDKRALFLLPMLQFTADSAVISGSILGFLKKIRMFNYLKFAKNNKFLLFLLFMYLSVLFLTLQWGIPSNSHPFPYHMDEWHQLQAVANTFRYGTPNTEGSANGTIFHFILSGLYLIPFIITKIIDPFSLQIDNAFMREKVFEVLRLNTALWGILSILLLYKIADFLKASKRVTVFFFIFSPIWLLLSGYFKYDIALVFWILLSLFFILRFAKDTSNKNFLIAAVPTAFAIAVKISALPLLGVYIFSYFLFNKSWRKNIRYLFVGVLAALTCVLLFGMPDTLFGRGNILDYLYDNLISTPSNSYDVVSGLDPYTYLFLKHFPLVFGYGTILVFIIALIDITGSVIKLGIYKYTRDNKIIFFLILSLLLFLVSLLTIKLTSAGNRTLVLLPFIVLIMGLEWKKIARYKYLSAVLLSSAVIAQLFISFAFIQIKLSPSPQETSSKWLVQNIPQSSIIGLENVPIYQQVPDIIQKEFYFQQYKIDQQYRYKYEIIDYMSEKLPEIIVITNENVDPKLWKDSKKRLLVNRLEKEGYKKIVEFLPNTAFYKFIGDDVDFYLSGLIATPWTTSVYQKK